MINDLLARGNIEKIKNNVEIKKANDYLTQSSAFQINKPEWLDNFIQINTTTLRGIICRSADEKGFLQTNHYNEGYFNEVIQNANDLHVGNRVNISIRRSGDIVSVKCVYRDKGFKIQDIYGFCNNGMSGKGDEHTGKFGIGIKAFFSFVDTFKITSNVIFDFSNLNDLDNLQQTCGLNSEWDRKHTILEFSFNAQKETVFNIGKLAKLAQLLDSEYEDGLADLFTSNSYDELLFDVHSLLFTDVQVDTHINEICLNNKLLLQCETIESYEQSKSIIKRKKVSIIYKDRPALYEREVTLFYKENMVFGFDQTDNENRLYSMYYLRNIKNEIIRNLGLYIHTPYTNPSRSDLGENEKEIDNRMKEIKEQLADLLFNIVEGASHSSFNDEVVSEFFHKCLNKYRSIEIFNEEQYNRNNIFYKCVETKKSNKQLLKLKGINKLQFYIVNEINTELYKQEYYPFEAEGTKEKLIQCYKEIIDKNEVLTLEEVLTSNKAIAYVGDLYEAMVGEEELEKESNDWVYQLLNYYPNVASFIKYRIDSYGDININSIANWLDETIKDFGKDIEDCLQKLLGRYEIHPSFSKYGIVKHSQLQLVDYLFMVQNVTPQSRLGELLLKNYNQQFAELKDVLSRYLITDVKYYAPSGPSKRRWEGKYRLNDNYINPNFLESDALIRLMDALNTESDVSERLWRHFSSIDNNLVLCQSDLNYNFTVNNKEFSEFYELKTAIIGMNFLKYLKVNELTQLFLYQDVVDRINQSINRKNYYSTDKLAGVEAHFEKITIKQLERLITWLVERIEKDLVIPLITIDIIETMNDKNLCDYTKREILEPLLNANIFQGELSVSGGNGKHLVIYIKNGVIKYMLGKDEQFKLIASNTTYNKENTIYIFGSLNLDSTKTLDYVLGDIEDALGKPIGDDTKEIIKSIIPIKTIGQTISTKQYERLKDRKYLNEKYLNDYKNITLNLAHYQNLRSNLQVQKRILLARGSYNHRCPRCSQPIDRPDQVGIFIIPYEKHDYKGIACWKCIELLKAGLTSVVYNEHEQYLDLYCKFHLSEHQSHPEISRIYLSHINQQLFY